MSVGAGLALPGQEGGQGDGRKSISDPVRAMRTSDFDYPLPRHLIAQTPVEPRDHSRLLVVNRSTGDLAHRRFYQVGDYLQEGDLLVLNDSRVIPARLRGRKLDTGGAVEVLLLHRRDAGLWEALVKPGRRMGRGARFVVDGAVGEVTEDTGEGTRLVSLSDEGVIQRAGEVPLPPYIHTPLADRERYQTVYARAEGSAAAPTAGLHFTPELLESLRQRGVRFASVTLHVGLDTFRPVKSEEPEQHKLHSERFELERMRPGR
ncbi:MAG: queA [Dehalococcoidia bacterium]|nr:queA [Dehalococcoidia bacterium]